MLSIRKHLTALMVALILSLLASCDTITGATKIGTATKSATKALTAFSLSEPSTALNAKISAKVGLGATPATSSGTINESSKTVSVSFPTGTDVSGLIATFTSTGASVRIGTAVQTSGTTSNSFASPVVYRVTAEDGSTSDYTVTVTVGLVSPPSSAKALTAFSLSAPSSAFNISTSARVAVGATPAAGAGTINESGKTVSVSFPAGTAATALVATFTTTGFSVKVGATVQTSGSTSNNFTAPVVYRVTAADGSTADYTVTVTVATAGVADTTAPALPTPSVTSTSTTNSVTLYWKVATDANALNYQVRYRATPTLNASVSSPRSVVVASGWTTATDWAPASSYPDTASGGSHPMYTVTGLTLGKSYDFAVSVRDTSLNQSDYTILTTSTVGDLVKPTLSASPLSISTSGGVTTMAWSDATDEVTSTANLRYWVGVSRNNISYGGDSAWTVASAFTRDGANRLLKTLVYNGVNLVAGNTYAVNLQAVDEAGNYSSDTTTTYMVPADVTPPSPSSSTLQMSVLGASYYLNWIKGTDADTVQNNLQYRVDRKLSTTSVWTAGVWTVATGLTTGRLSDQYQSLPVSLTSGTWQFIVYVKDEAGNIGNPYTTFTYTKS